MTGHTKRLGRRAGAAAAALGLALAGSLVAGGAAHGVTGGGEEIRCGTTARRVYSDSL